MTPTPKDIAALFNKFVGKELKDPQRVTCDLDHVYEEMKQVANDNGLELRLHFPGRPSTPDYREKRVNVLVKESADNRFVVGKTFGMG